MKRMARFYRPARLPRISRRRFAAASVAVACCLVAGSLLFSEYGLRNLLDLRRTESALEREVADLKARRAALAQEKEALASDPVALEKIAREKYLLARDDEMTYVFVPVDSTGAPLPPAASGFAGAGPGATIRSADAPATSTRP
jgi:cell division protein FtsB